MLDPRERCSVAECLEHVAFETERLLHRNHGSAVARRGRKQSATRVLDADGRSFSRASSVAAEVRFTPVPPPPDRMEFRSTSPPDRSRGTPALQSHEPAENQPTSTVRSSLDHARLISDSEPGAHRSTEPSQVEFTTSRFLRRKPVTGTRLTEDEDPVDQPATGGLLARDVINTFYIF